MYLHDTGVERSPWYSLNASGSSFLLSAGMNAFLLLWREGQLAANKIKFNKVVQCSLKCRVSMKLWNISGDNQIRRKAKRFHNFLLEFKCNRKSGLVKALIETVKDLAYLWWYFFCPNMVVKLKTRLQAQRRNDFDVLRNNWKYCCRVAVLSM